MTNEGDREVLILSCPRAAPPGDMQAGKLRFS